MSLLGVVRSVLTNRSVPTIPDRSALSKPLTEEYIDLTAVVLLTLSTVAVALGPVVRETPLRAVIGLLFIIFAPGWALVAALFPARKGAVKSPASNTAVAHEDAVDPESKLAEDLSMSRSKLEQALDQIGTTFEELADDSESITGAERREDATIGSTDDTYLSGIERLALALGTGLAVVSLAGLALNYTPWPIALEPILATLGGLTLSFTAVATLRRRALTPSQRFRVPLGRVRDSLTGPKTTTDRAINGVLLLSVLLLVGTMAFTLAVPSPDDRYSSLYVLTEDDDGELIAGNYTEALDPDSDRELIIGIENQEHESVDYQLVIQREQIAEDRSTVEEREELERITQTVPHDSTVQLEHRLTIDEPSETLRVTYLLYTDEVPAEPTQENADRYVHIWTQAPPGGEPIGGSTEDDESNQ